MDFNDPQRYPYQINQSFRTPSPRFGYFNSPSPRYQNYPRFSTPRSWCSPQYRGPYDQQNRFSGGSPGNWKNRRSYGSSDSSGSFSPFNRNQRPFRSPASEDSNPGHSNDIRQYVHPSMLEDPWAQLEAKYKEGKHS